MGNTCTMMGYTCSCQATSELHHAEFASPENQMQQHAQRPASQLQPETEKSSNPQLYNPQQLQVQKSQEEFIEAHPDFIDYQKCIKITICNSQYGKRKRSVNRKEKEGDKDVYKEVQEQINTNLPGTLEDERNFQIVLNNFQFQPEDTKEYFIREAKWTEIKKIMEESQQLVSQYAKNGKKTLLIFFYAGHGAMRNNEQVLILDGENVTTNNIKREKDGRTIVRDEHGKQLREKKTELKYVFEIEKQFKNKFSQFNDKCLIWATYDCCRSYFKEIDDAIFIEEDEHQRDENNQNAQTDKENKRGDGDSTGLNIFIIQGCQANSIVKDKNQLVERIISELRLHQKEKNIILPDAFFELSKKFPGCMISDSTIARAKVKYVDQTFVQYEFDPDTVKNEEIEEQSHEVVQPKSFNPSKTFLIQGFIELKDGWFYGTSIDSIPHGFGRMLFQPGVNYHDKVEQVGAEPGVFKFVFYEGNFKYGKLHGHGKLFQQADMTTERILIGQFQNNIFSGKGQDIYRNPNDKVFGVGYNYSGPHGQYTAQFNKGDSEPLFFHGAHRQGKLVGLNTRLISKQTYRGQLKHDEPDGLGFQNYSDGDKTFIGIFRTDDPALGKTIDKNGNFNKGQLISDEKNTFGYNEEYTKNGSCTYKGFFNENGSRHGIGMSIDSKGNQKFQIYDNGECIEDNLTKKQIKDLNNSAVIEQMQYFNQKCEYSKHKNKLRRDYLNYKTNDKLNFYWIENQGRQISLLVDDLEQLARQHNMQNHKIDKNTLDQLKQLVEEEEEIFNKIIEAIDNYRALATIHGFKVTQTHWYLQRDKSNEERRIKHYYQEIKEYNDVINDHQMDKQKQQEEIDKLEPLIEEKYPEKHKQIQSIKQKIEPVDKVLEEVYSKQKEEGVTQSHHGWNWTMEKYEKEEILKNQESDTTKNEELVKEIEEYQAKLEEANKTFEVLSQKIECQEKAKNREMVKNIFENDYINKKATKSEDKESILNNKISDYPQDIKDMFAAQTELQNIFSTFHEQNQDLQYNIDYAINKHREEKKMQPEAEEAKNQAEDVITR